MKEKDELEEECESLVEKLELFSEKVGKLEHHMQIQSSNKEKLD